jgi:hypothetical protein
MGFAFKLYDAFFTISNLSIESNLFLTLHLSSRLLSKNIKQNYNFACGSIWVSNLLSDANGGTLRVSENRVLRIFGPKRDEMTGGWRKLHNEELHNLYSSLSIIRMIKSRRIRWAGHVARMGEKRNNYIIFVGKPERKRPLGRRRRRWVDNIKMDLREIGWDGMDWTDLTQVRDQCRVLVNKVMNFRVLGNS